VACNASKPGRPDGNAWVLHASPDWSAAHLEDDPDRVIPALLAAAGDLPGATRCAAESAWAHRWLYARADEPLDRQAIWLDSHSLALAGDWCHGSRVEGAFLSGAAAAGRVMQMCARKP
jgi:hypothetical protein